MEASSCCDSSGLVSQSQSGGRVSKGSGLTRGDVRRNARKASRWMVVQELCRARGLPLVCVQPLVSHVAREQQDLTGDKADEPDSELIARLARELHCYVPEELEAGWAELRAAGRDRAAQVTR